MKISDLPKVTQTFTPNPYIYNHTLSAIMSDWRSYNLKITFTEHSYKALPAIGQVFCKVKGTLHTDNSAILTFTKIGRAVCREGDTYDEEKGKKLARAIAEKKAFEFCEKKVRYASKLLADRQNLLDQFRAKMNNLIDHQNDYIKTF